MTATATAADKKRMFAAATAPLLLLDGALAADPSTRGYTETMLLALILED